MFLFSRIPAPTDLVPIEQFSSLCGGLLRVLYIHPAKTANQLPSAGHNSPSDFFCFVSALFSVGCANGRPTRHRKDDVGQSRGDRMWNYFLQRVLLHPHLQIQGRVREACPSAVWNGECFWLGKKTKKHPDILLIIFLHLYYFLSLGQVLRSNNYLHRWNRLHLWQERDLRWTWSQPPRQIRTPGSDGRLVDHRKKVLCIVVDWVDQPQKQELQA